MQKYLINPELTDEVKFWINHNLCNYLKTNPENQGEIEHIIDYLQSEEAPKRLKKMSYMEASKAAKVWTETMNKKAGGICETDEDIRTVINFGNGSKLVQLIGKHAFQREGLLMSNCVASYYGKKDVAIYSLRDSKNNPHVTIEVHISNGQINQIKGKGNGSIHPKYIKYVLASLDKLGGPVRLSEMTHLGYDQLPDNSMWKFLEANFKGIQHITYQNTKLLYRHSKLTRR